MILVPVCDFLARITNYPSEGYRRRSYIFRQVFRQSPALLRNLAPGYMGDKSLRIPPVQFIDCRLHLIAWHHLLQHLEQMILPLLMNNLIRKIPQFQPLASLLVDPSTRHDDVKMGIVSAWTSMGLNHYNGSNLYLLLHTSTNNILQTLIPTTHQRRQKIPLPPVSIEVNPQLLRYR